MLDNIGEMLVLTTSWYLEPAENEDHEEPGEYAEHAFPGIYHKVASSRLSRLVTQQSIFRLFMKGKFVAFVLRPKPKEFEIE